MKYIFSNVFCSFIENNEENKIETLWRRGTGIFYQFWTRATHQRQCDHVGQGHGDSDNQRLFPALGDCVCGGYEKESNEVEHVQGGRQGAPELRLAHLTAVRYAQAGGETRAETH